MVMQIDDDNNVAVSSQTASEEEIRRVAQESIATLERQDIQDKETVSVGDAPQEMRQGMVKPLQYRIAPSDEGSWVMVWELKIDANGEVYGEPTRAPRQQLGLWLSKKRQDGGPRFTYQQPNRIKAEPQFKCLIRTCPKGLYTRFDLVEHVENVHERESRMYRKLLDQILEQVADDNPRVKELAATYAAMEDKGVVSMEINPTARREDIDPNLGAPVVQSIGITKKEPHIDMQEQPQGPDMPVLHYCTIGGCKRFFDSPGAMNMHVQNGHKGHRPAEV